MAADEEKGPTKPAKTAMSIETQPGNGAPPAQPRCSEPGRGRGRPFKPGQSGNPGGRPKKVQELAALAQENMPMAILYAAHVGLRDEDGRVAIAAATFLRDTAMGRPIGTHVDLTKVSDEALQAEVRRRATGPNSE